MALGFLFIGPVVSRVFAFVDGFNLYHALVDSRDLARFRWLDLSGLVASLVPAKTIGIAIPPGRRAESLKQAADFHMKIKPKHLATNLLPDSIDLGGGHRLDRPESWK